MLKQSYKYQKICLVHVYYYLLGLIYHNNNNILIKKEGQLGIKFRLKYLDNLV